MTHLTYETIPFVWPRQPSASTQSIHSLRREKREAFYAKTYLLKNTSVLQTNKTYTKHTRNSLNSKRHNKQETKKKRQTANWSSNALVYLFDFYVCFVFVAVHTIQYLVCTKLCAAVMLREHLSSTTASNTWPRNC